MHTKLQFGFSIFSAIKRAFSCEKKQTLFSCFHILIRAAAKVNGYVINIIIHFCLSSESHKKIKNKK